MSPVFVARPNPAPGAIVMGAGLGNSHTLPLSDGDQGTVETIDFIRQLVDQGVKDPIVNRTAIAIIQAAGVKQFDFSGEVRAIFEWVRQNIRFTRDIAGKETLRTAREILTVRAGDCDDINAILMPSLLGSVGHRVRLVTISSHPMLPKVFSHIYAEVWMSGRWVPLDAARRDAAFGRGPNHFFRKRVWSLSSGDYKDIAGLGYYQPAPGMGFDWSTFGDAVSKITGSAVNVISAIRTPSFKLPAPTTAAPPPSSAPSGVVSLGPGGASGFGSIPPWMMYTGFGLLALAVLRGK